MIKELVYKFQNPYNSCEKVYFHKETNKYYILQPSQNKGEQCLLTCTPSGGYYEADCPIREGLSYIIDGETVTTLKDGMVRNEEVYQQWQNEELVCYKIKEEFRNIENYFRSFNIDALLIRPYDYILPEHLDQITVKRKDVFRISNSYYLND